MKRVAIAGAAGLLAGLGVYWYVRAPGPGSYQASSLLTAPALLVTCVWLHRRTPLGLQWAAAWMLAVAGPVGYLVWGGAQWWNWGQLMPVPLILLAVRSADDDDEHEPWYGGVADGPWGPP